MSDEWAKAFMDAINNNAAYREAAADWEGDFYFVAEMKGREKATVYLDLWHGECRDAFLVSEDNAPKPEFVVSGKIAAWKKVIAKKVDPIQGLMTRQLKLQGNMAKVLRAVKAAQELVNSATMIETEFPE